MSLTTDPDDPRLTRGADTTPGPQSEAYLVLSEEERRKGFLLPVRRSYRHASCGTVTTMAPPIAETYARDPWFYGGTYCVTCSMHRPLSEFQWEPDGSPMSPHAWSAATLEAVVARQKSLAGQAGAQEGSMKVEVFIKLAEQSGTLYRIGSATLQSIRSAIAAHGVEEQNAQLDAIIADAEARIERAKAEAGRTE